MTTRKDRKRFSKEFKFQTIKRCEESGKPVTEIARELDISAHRLYKWRDDYYKNPDKAFQGSGNANKNKTNSEKAFDQLRRENARLKEDLDILKKSLIFFAKEQSKNSDL